MSNFNLSRSKCGLLIIDLQEKLFSHVERAQDVLKAIQKVIAGFQIMNLPVYVSEQYPEGLGSTIMPLQIMLGNEYNPLIKSTFSCLDDPTVHRYLMGLPIQQWIVVGIEAHICVLQTAKALHNAGKEVVVLNDAISSRSIYDYSTSIAEMGRFLRVSSVETILFELLKDSHAPEFKAISDLVKTRCCCC
jgi:nicotinamidase-related amidase